jgi:hypothetical protein
MTEPTHPLKRLLTEGAFLAAVPVVASLVAYLYEFGYLSFYQAPPAFIQLDITRILTATAVVLIAIMMFLMLLASAADVAAGKHPFKRAIGRSLLFSVVLLPFFALLPNTAHNWIVFAVLSALPLLAELLPPLFERKTGLKYSERLAAAEENQIGPNKRAQYTTISQALGKWVVVPVGSVFFAGFLVVLLGDVWARNKTVYWVLADQPDTFLVAHYGDVVLLKRVNLATRQITNELVVQKIGDSTPLKLKQVTLGELKKPKLSPEG